MAHREEINSPGVSPESRHNEGASGEVSHDGLHPNAADFIQRVYGHDVPLEGLDQRAANLLTEQLLGIYSAGQTKTRPTFRKAVERRVKLVAEYVAGTPSEQEEVKLFSQDRFSLEVNIVAWWLGDRNARAGGRFVGSLLEKARGWTRPVFAGVQDRPTQKKAEPPAEEDEAASEEILEPAKPAQQEPGPPAGTTPSEPSLRAPRRLTTLNFISFLPEESRNASQEDIDRLIGWIQAAAAVWVRRNRGVELGTDATEEELGTILGIGELALRQLIRSVLIKEVGIQAYYLGDRGMDRDDLMSHGLLGGLKAIDYYHSQQGGNFRSYARSFIKGAMRHALRDEMPVIHLPRRKHEELHRIRQVQSTKQDATIEYIARELNMQQREVKAILEAGDRVLMSFNAMTFEPVITAKNAITESSEKYIRLHKALAGLSSREADAVRLRFGISDGPESEGATAPRSVDDVAAAMGLSRSRIDVLLRTAREKLKDSLDDAELSD
jgi:RNA polymerase sigma factor (sigma-70 family)